jgi:CheY-like chemotaxis protein
LAGQCPLSILVCEDNVVNQRVIGHMLKKLGYSPLFASDGFEGLDECRRQRIDLILMDVQMPRMGGLELTRKVRKEFGGAADGGPYIVALTAAAMLEDRIECLEAGMDHYLSKPVPTSKLQETIHLAWACQHPTQPTPDAPAGASPPDALSDLLDMEQIDLLVSFGETPGEGHAILAILRDFQETLPSQWKSLSGALATGDHEAQKKALHKLKGAGRSIGLKAVGEVAANYESKAEEGGTVPESVLTELQDLVGQSLHSLDAYLQEQGVGSFL